MTATKEVADRFREVILNGKWIANTNFKDQVYDLDWRQATMQVGSLNTIALLTFLYGLVVVLLTHHLAERMRANPTIARVLEKLAGVFLIGFGVKLAISK